jgi:hypothetical protein
MQHCRSTLPTRTKDVPCKPAIFKNDPGAAVNEIDFSRACIAFRSKDETDTGARPIALPL